MAVAVARHGDGDGMRMRIYSCSDAAMAFVYIASTVELALLHRFSNARMIPRSSLVSFSQQTKSP
jgi:hypothetical protein